MKKLLVSLVLLIPLVTGCASIDTKVTLNDNKSATVGTSLTYKGNLADKSNAVSKNISDTYSNFIDKYYKVDAASSERLSTINAIKKVNNVEKQDLDLSSLGFETKLPSKKYIELKKNFVIKSYNIHLVYDFPKISKQLALKAIKSEESETKGLVPEYYHKYINPADVDAGDSNSEYDMAANIDESAKILASEDESSADKNSKKENDDPLNVSFSIEVPAFASSNNADYVKGNVYTWNIKKNEPTEIQLQYVCYSGWAFSFIVAIGILFLCYVAKRIRRRDSQKRIDNIENII